MKRKQFIFPILIVVVLGFGIVLAAPLELPKPVLDISKTKIKDKYEKSEIKNKYKLQKASFIKEAKDKNCVQIEVGDKAKNKFTPEMTIRKWDDEVNLKVKYKHNIKEKDQIVDLEGDKIKWKNHKTEVHYYKMKKGEILFGNELENDVYEIEVILLEKPDTNAVEFEIETNGLKYYYQPPLNEEIKIGDEDGRIVEVTETYAKDKDGNVVVHRPENVIGSYAVYHESKQGDYSKMGGKNYRAGIAFHIYRPKIIDAAGTEVWGKLNIDVENKLLTVEIPQEFLDNAVYPIRHAAGLTFGYTTMGSSTISLNDVIRGSRFTGAAGTVDSINANVQMEGVDSYCRHAIYKYSDSSKVCQSAEGADPEGWTNLNVSGSPSITTIGYVLVTHGTVADGDITIRYNSGDAGQGHSQSRAYSSGYPATASFSQNNFKYSIYCTYTETPSNTIPNATSVSDAPDPVNVGSDVTFTGGWTESDSGDNVKMYVCKNSNCANCNNSSQSECWCYSSAFQTEPDVSDTCTYTAQSGDVGDKSYWLGVCDDEPSCDATPFLGGTFTVQHTLVFTVDSGTKNLGNITPGTPITETTTATVTTSDTNGYSLKVHDSVAGSDSALVQSGTYISDYAGTISTPTLWTGTGLGISVYAADTNKEAKWGTGITATDSNNKYAGIPQTATEIHNVSSNVTSDTTSVGYKLDVANNQKTGAYSGDVTYTVIVNP